MSGTYTTVQGDMWDGIAYKALGSTGYTGALLALNREYVDYYIFPAGITLRLPEVSSVEIDNSTLPPWKQVSG